MSTQISGTLGVSKIQDNSIDPEDLKLAASSIGVGQTWQDVTASRASGVDYTNATGKPIQIAVYQAAGASAGMVVTVGGLAILNLVNASTARNYAVFIVPPGVTYRVTVTVTAISVWTELR
jgi:hypothetical protein